MAPLHEAINLADLIVVRTDGSARYDGDIDDEWAYDSHPHGGYITALLLATVLRYRDGIAPRDVMHLSTHFANKPILSRYSILIYPIRAGKRIHMIRATLYQRDIPRVIAQIIFGTLPPLVEAEDTTRAQPLTLPSTSPFFGTIPLSSHPRFARRSPAPPLARFAHRMQWAFDPRPLIRNRSRASSTNETKADVNRAAAPGGNVPVEWGAWFDFLDCSARLDSPAIAFLSDVFMRAPDLLVAADPDDKHSRNTTTQHLFYTTLVINLEFRYSLPVVPEDSARSSRSVGLYSTSTFLWSGLHDGRVEIWTAPAAIGRNEGTESDWRAQQRCLAVATQLTVARPAKKNPIDRSARVEYAVSGPKL